MTRRAPPSAAEFLFQEARSAVRDIRQKLFEEAWFGRAVTDARPREFDLSRETVERAAHDQRFDEAWGRKGPEREREHREPDLEHDR